VAQDVSRSLCVLIGMICITASAATAQLFSLYDLRLSSSNTIVGIDGRPPQPLTPLGIMTVDSDSRFATGTDIGRFPGVGTRVGLRRTLGDPADDQFAEASSSYRASTSASNIAPIGGVIRGSAAGTLSLAYGTSTTEIESFRSTHASRAFVDVSTPYRLRASSVSSLSGPLEGLDAKLQVLFRFRRIAAGAEPVFADLSIQAEEDGAIDEVMVFEPEFTEVFESGPVEVEMFTQIEFSERDDWAGESVSGNVSWSFSYDLYFEAVPAPSTAVVLAGIGASMLRRRRSPT